MCTYSRACLLSSRETVSAYQISVEMSQESPSREGQLPQGSGEEKSVIGRVILLSQGHYIDVHNAIPSIQKENENTRSFVRVKSILFCLIHFFHLLYSYFSFVPLFILFFYFRSPLCVSSLDLFWKIHTKHSRQYITRV